MCLFSILVVTKNNAEGLNKTLQSIFDLDYDNYEVIIQDGRSNDNTAEIVANFGQLVNSFVSEPDEGIYNAMNKAVARAKGDFVVFMNAGDCFASSDVLSFVTNYDADIILGASTYGGIKRYPPTNISLYSLLSVGMCHQSTFYKLNVLKKYPFDERLRIIADLKSVVEPYSKDRIHILSFDKLMSVCEGNGLSKKQWRQIALEKELLINDCIDEFYVDDYHKLSHISNSVIKDFETISQFSSLFPAIHMLASLARKFNQWFKHIPMVDCIR